MEIGDTVSTRERKLFEGFFEIFRDRTRRGEIAKRMWGSRNFDNYKERAADGIYGSGKGHLCRFDGSGS